MSLASAYEAAGRLRENILHQIQRAIIATFRAGPVPRHVAFVMDGNRRYARSQGKHVFEGHLNGFYALRRILEIMYLLGVQCVSVYAFAIDNFKRPAEEVDALMKLAEERLIEFCQHDGVLAEYGVRLVAVGNLDLCPPAVQAALRKAEDLTKDNTKAVFNLCISYSSRDEMATAVEDAINEKLDAQSHASVPLSPTVGTLFERPHSPITVAEIDAHMMTAKAASPPLDIYVRTSGVTRFSDYLLWQCCEDTQIQFIDRYWPEIGILDMVPVLLDYQRKVWTQ